MATFQFGLSQNQNFSSRIVYNIFNWFSDVGGINGAIVTLVSVVTGLYADKLSAIQKAESSYKYDPKPSDSLNESEE